MTSAIYIARTLGILLALFLAMSAIVNLSGELNSVEAPPFAERVLSVLPATALCVLLLVPQRVFLRGIRYTALLVAFALAVAAFAAVIARDAVRTLSGEVHWALVPVGVFFCLIVLGNAIALWAQHRRQPPNNLFKPNLNFTR